MTGAPAPDAPFSDYEGRDLEALSCLNRYRQWIYDSMAAHIGGRVVEIGAGIGTFSELLQSASDELVLVEPGRNQVAALQEKFAGARRVEVVCADALAWARGCPAESFDAVVMINVLEHVEHDTELLAELHRILRRDGRLCIYVPALMSLFSDMDRKYGHFRRYRRAELRGRVAGAGFAILKERWMDAPGALAWLIICRMLRSVDFNPALARIYDTVFVPPIRFIEGIVPPPVAKNLLFIGRRP